MFFIEEGLSRLAFRNLQTFVGAWLEFGMLTS